MPQLMTVRVRDRDAEAPWGSPGLITPRVRTITISALCPECPGLRGEPMNRDLCDDGAYYSVDVWTNPCGHVDTHEAVLAEWRGAFERRPSVTEATLALIDKPNAP